LLKAALQGEERRQTLDLFGPPARVLLVHAQPVDVGGALATISDITERARLDAVRTDFVANISHELKTPVGALSLLAEALADCDDPEIVTRLSGKIVKEAERLTLAIEDLLELSRIELGGEANWERLSTVRILEDAADRVRVLAERRHIRLEIQKEAQPLFVVGDRRQLVSAIGNLVDNAVKYSEMDSTVRLGACLDGDRLTFSVADSGMGIASQHLDRIFERFYRVDRARSRDTGGVGLGLAIVRHVAANHGGEVKVTSQEGEGSTFMLSIPVVPASVTITQAVDAVSSDR
jgi:two-component system sensor histidine kinase SenX3